MIYLPTVEGLFVGQEGVMKIMLDGVQVWPLVPTVETVNTAVTGDYFIGNGIKDVDEIIPYGYYVFKWTSSGSTYAKLTEPYEQVYVSERYNYTFIKAVENNGIMPEYYAQRVRIVQAIPMSDVPELSGTTIYLPKNPPPGTDVYTGKAYLLYDIYNEKYIGYNFLNSFVHFDDASEFYPETSTANVICNALRDSNDGNKVAMRKPMQTDSNSWLPRAHYIPDYERYVFDGTPQFVNDGPRPYNYDTDEKWQAAKVDIVPLLTQPDYIANAPDNMSGSPINVWFDSGFIASADTCMEIKVANVNFTPNANQNILGAAGVSASQHFALLFPRNNTYHICYIRYNGRFAQSTSADYAIPNKPYVCTMWKDGGTLKLDVDGTLITGATPSAATTAPGVSLYFFARNQDGTINTATRCYGGCKIYYAKIYDRYGGTLLHHFVPWIDNGEACFKDLVAGNIIHNLGTDTPVYGYD